MAAPRIGDWFTSTELPVSSFDRVILQAQAEQHVNPCGTETLLRIEDYQHQSFHRWEDNFFFFRGNNQRNGRFFIRASHEPAPACGQVRISPASGWQLKGDTWDTSWGSSSSNHVVKTLCHKLPIFLGMVTIPTYKNGDFPGGPMGN